ncbi:FAD-dependent oxidoreductase [Comamonas sp. GB3 AK4-5]|uniref:FAD-dependent oxidoreductase n=1 Tax=Comamonas sp. GB3 AK4-5 TaxID=3231487 RepID=UPI00351ECC1B
MPTSHSSSSSRQAQAVVIGAGSAGMNAFHALRQWGVDVLLVDRGPLGTTCARVGCMPSKAMLHAAAQWQCLSQGTVSPVGTYQQPHQLWQQALAVRDELAGAQAQRTLALGERLLQGAARFTGPHTLEVEGQGGEITAITAQAFVLATGSRPVVPAALQALGDAVITTDALFSLEAPPPRVGVLGLGAIGVEMGMALQRLGCEVIAADLHTAPAGLTDPVAAELATAWLGRSLDMHLGQAAQVERVGCSLRFTVGHTSREVDRVLLAVGRRPNWEDLQLQHAVEDWPEKAQKLLNTQTLQVGSAPVFAAGDVSGIRPLMHEAVDQGRLAAWQVARLLGLSTGSEAPQPRTPLSIVFTNPDIAQVGMPWQALDPAHTVIGTARGAGNGRSKVMHARDNLLRIYADRATGRLLGATIVAERGEHLAHLLAWAVMRGETVHSLQELPTYHPCVEEMIPSALQDAARQCQPGGPR